MTSWLRGQRGPIDSLWSGRSGCCRPDRRVPVYPGERRPSRVSAPPGPVSTRSASTSTPRKKENRPYWATKLGKKLLKKEKKSGGPYADVGGDDGLHVETGDVGALDRRIAWVPVRPVHPPGR